MQSSPRAVPTGRCCATTPDAMQHHPLPLCSDAPACQQTPVASTCKATCNKQTPGNGQMPFASNQSCTPGKTLDMAHIHNPTRIQAVVLPNHCQRCLPSCWGEALVHPSRKSHPSGKAPTCARRSPSLHAALEQLLKALALELPVAKGTRDRQNVAHAAVVHPRTRRQHAVHLGPHRRPLGEAGAGAGG